MKMKKSIVCALITTNVVVLVVYVPLITEWSLLSNTKPINLHTKLLRGNDLQSCPSVPNTQTGESNSNSKSFVHKEIRGNEEVTIIKSQNHTIELRRSVDSKAKELILLVSTLGRGGSSWVGELLSNSSKDLMYVFEPLKIVGYGKKTDLTPDIDRKIFSMVFHCRFDATFINFRKKWNYNFQKFPDVCRGNNCFKPSRLNNRCQKAKTIVAKSIRLPLEHAEHLIKDPQFQNLKIVYLGRDPRAQIVSRGRVFRVKHSNYSTECKKVQSDVFAFHRLSKLYPGRFYFMRYEDLCRNLEDEALHLWRFLQADPEASLPDSWAEYLVTHEKKRKVKYVDYSTFKNTTTQWYMWRKEKRVANENLLRSVESHCSVAMAHLGYIPLQTAENVRNLSIPFIKDYSCDFWNCWTYRF